MSGRAAFIGYACIFLTMAVIGLISENWGTVIQYLHTSYYIPLLIIPLVALIIKLFIDLNKYKQHEAYIIKELSKDYPKDLSVSYIQGYYKDIESMIRHLQYQHDDIVRKIEKEKQNYIYAINSTDRVSADLRRLEKERRELGIEKRRIDNYRISSHKDIEIWKNSALQDIEIRKQVWEREMAEFQLAISRSIDYAFSETARKFSIQYANEISDIIQYLAEKPHPILPQTVSEFRKQLNNETKLYLKNWKETQYKYEYILNLYQITEEDIEEDAELEEELNEKDFLSESEYQQLSSAQKSDLALKRYNERRKGIRRIGYDYELFCGYWMRMQMFCHSIIQYGEQQGKADHGRDIIAFNGSITYIVQCKRWSDNKRIHEKHIFQLFGSTVQYCIQNNIPVTEIGNHIIPLFLTTTTFSVDAERFAKELNVQTITLPQGDFPQIKCNIGSDGTKIYHLPFDQQYDRVVINHHSGEYYAWTAEDAESKGFRRAQRHIFNDRQ